MDNLLLKTKLNEVIRVLSKGDKTFTQIQNLTGFSPATVATYLAKLEEGSYIKRKIAGKRIVYSISKEVMLSLVWDLLEFQEKNAWYTHVDAPSYWQYGLKTDYLCLPRPEQEDMSLEAKTALEKAFMEALGKTAGSSGLPLKSKEGKLLVAFEVDLGMFSEEMKKTGGKIMLYQIPKKNLGISEKVGYIKQHKKNWIVESETGKIYNRETKEEIPWKTQKT